MNLIFKEDQPEEYYRKLLLLDKVKPFLALSEKTYIFFKSYCWDLLLKDKAAPFLCCNYALIYKDNFGGRFRRGEKFIALDGFYSYQYAIDILKDRFPEGEEAIFKEGWKKSYINFLEKIGKSDGLQI